jgi:hypothetical protein
VCRTKRVEKDSQKWLSHSSEVAPVVEFVGVLRPAVAYVGAVVHVGDEDIFDLGINLGLSLLHCEVSVKEF